jgi:hypothetical protein
MNPMNTHSSRWIVSATATITLAALASANPVPGEDGKVHSTTRHVITSNITGDDNHVIEIRIEDGDITIKRDGKEVPEARIKREDGRVIILDDQGHEIETVNLFGYGDDGDFMFQLGDAGNWAGLAKLAEVQAKNPPKVMIGIQTTDPGPALQKHLHLEPGAAVMIGGIYEGLPAAEAGLEQYDIIVKVNGEALSDDKPVAALLAEKEPGDTVLLKVIQAGEPKELKVKLMAYDAERLKEARLVGGAPMASAWVNVEGPGLDKQKWLNLRGLVTPDGNLFEKLRTLPQDGEMYWQFATPHGQPIPLQPGPSADDVRQRLDRLDSKMNQLENLLQELIDQKKGAR